MMDTTKQEKNRRVGVLLALLAVVASVGLLAGAGAAVPENGTNVSEKAPYYSNNSTAVDNSSWMEGHREPSLANVVHYSTRFSAFVIGTGTQQEGGWTGPVITGLVVYGMVMSLIYRAGIGPVGGSVTMVTASFGLTTAGLAPMWVFAVGLFGVGGILAWVIRRALR